MEEGANSSMFRQYQIVQRVKERRGATLFWQVDLEKRIAKVESIIEVSFYKLQSGGFSLAGYRRIDQELPIIEQDQPLLEEAIFMIHKALKPSNPSTIKSTA